MRSVKGECLSTLTLFGEVSLRRALTDFIDHFHAERNHQGEGNVLIFPSEKGWPSQVQKPGTLSGAPWRAIEVLPLCCMNFLTIRDVLAKHARERSSYRSDR